MSEKKLPHLSGVPTPRKFENTGEIEEAVTRAIESPENTEVALAKLILGAVQHTEDDTHDNGLKYVKEIKRHKWVAAIMALFLGPGGAVAVVYATSDRSKENAAKIEVHDTYDSRIQKTEKSVEEIKHDIGKIQTSVSAAKSQQAEILSGIGELKKENINRMTKELEETKRLLRRAERKLDQ